MPLEFGEFLNRFPTVELPLTLGEEAHHVFSTENQPLSAEMIEQFIASLDGGPQDEFTEYVPCFSFVTEEQYVGLVWWKAELLNYQYVLAVFSAKGEPLDRQVISYTQVKGAAIRRAVATIDTDFSILIAEGLSDTELYDPESTRTRVLEILPNGRIVSGDQ
ncbi:MAG: hypothetical protein ACK5SQ_01325 [Chitinophagales bacterium]